jgi:hypothetical protein
MQVATSLLRSLPSLMTQLNMEVWGKDEQEEDRDIALGDFVLHNGDLLPADHDSVAGLGLEVLHPDTLLMHIQQKLHGGEAIGDIKTLKDQAKGLKFDDVIKTGSLWA